MITNTMITANFSKYIKLLLYKQLFKIIENNSYFRTKMYHKNHKSFILTRLSI
jgi:hypothetical protein